MLSLLAWKVSGIADDMIIAGKDKMEDDRNFVAFMEKCMENNLGEDPVQTKTGSFLWTRLVRSRNFTRSQEDTGTKTYGIPTR